MTKRILYYVHDPMCSWCFGFSQTYKQLLKSLPADIVVVRLLGGLAPDSDTPMPYDMQIRLQKTWHTIEEQIPGVKFNFDFWDTQLPRRSTYPACRAVIAARNQGLENDVLMTEAIQRAYYQQARNPSDVTILVELAKEIRLDGERFKNDLVSARINKQLIAEMSLSRQLYAESYPSLVLVADDEYSEIPINYTSSESMLNAIKQSLNFKQ